MIEICNKQKKYNLYDENTSDKLFDKFVSQ